MATQSVATRSVRPWVMTTPLGTPVVPEVNRMSDGSSGPSVGAPAIHGSPGWRRRPGPGTRPTTRRRRAPDRAATMTVARSGSSVPVAPSMAT